MKDRALSKNRGSIIGNYHILYNSIYFFSFFASINFLEFFSINFHVLQNKRFKEFVEIYFVKLNFQIFYFLSGRDK